MTPDEQRIAIAEACPEVFVRPVGHSGWKYKSSIANRVLPCIDGDPLSDLNAMHEAEKGLDDQGMDKRSLFLDYLYIIVGWGDAGNPADAKFEGQYRCVRSTASQRAEAFLRTLGKWKESK